MRILAIDTTTELCSVALSIDGVIRSEEKLDPTGHSRLVLDMIERLLCNAELKLSDLDLLACDVGPGSFTGIRIGIGVTQGLAYGANLPIVSITSLAALALGVKNDGYVFSAIDARMGEVYWAIHKKENSQISLVGDLVLSSPELVKLPIDCMEQDVNCIGSGWNMYSDILGTNISPLESEPHQFPHAEQLIQLAVASNKEEYIGVSQLSPVYLRSKVASIGTKNPLIA